MLTSAGAPVLPLLRLLARWPDACYAALADRVESLAHAG